LLRRLRAIVGDTVPIVYSLDYHANVTRAMLRHADGCEAYRTYPHVDRPDTGVRAARVLQQVLARGRPTGRALRKTDFLLPLDSQCTMIDPSKAIVAHSAALQAGDVLSVAYLAGFPPSDLSECGPSVIVYAWTQAAADAAADALLRDVAAREGEFAQPLLQPDEAVVEAMHIAQCVLVALAPGAHVVDPTQYPFQRLRVGVGLYPLGPVHTAARAD
jgi:microcystin degradation protein MlrC